MGEAAHGGARPSEHVAEVAGTHDDRARGGAGPKPDHARLLQPAADSSYQVRIEGFEGPFGLLMHLIAQRKLEISEVDLADITGDFLAHLEQLEDGAFDLDTATHFLVVAATLVELKAARLLPPEGGEQFEAILEEARDLLYARLLEFRAFREASGFMVELLDENEGYIGREVPLEQPFRDLVPHARRSIHAADLAALASAVLAPKVPPRVSVAHIRHSRLTISEAAARLLARMRRVGERAPFNLLVSGCSRGEQVVHFLALLELFKIGYVDLHQFECWAPLEVERCGAGTISPYWNGSVSAASPGDRSMRGPDEAERGSGSDAEVVACAR